jgi:hypothetical protein
LPLLNTLPGLIFSLANCALSIANWDKRWQTGAQRHYLSKQPRRKAGALNEERILLELEKEYEEGLGKKPSVFKDMLKKFMDCRSSGTDFNV